MGSQELFCMLVILPVQSGEQGTVCPEWGRTSLTLNSSRKKQEKMVLLHWYLTQPQRNNIGTITSSGILLSCDAVSSRAWLAMHTS